MEHIVIGAVRPFARPRPARAAWFGGGWLVGWLVPDIDQVLRPYRPPGERGEGGCGHLRRPSNKAWVAGWLTYQSRYCPAYLTCLAYPLHVLRTYIGVCLIVGCVIYVISYACGIACFCCIVFPFGRARSLTCAIHPSLFCLSLSARRPVGEDHHHQGGGIMSAVVGTYIAAAHAID